MRSALSIRKALKGDLIKTLAAASAEHDACLHYSHLVFQIPRAAWTWMVGSVYVTVADAEVVGHPDG